MDWIKKHSDQFALALLALILLALSVLLFLKTQSFSEGFGAALDKPPKSTEIEKYPTTAIDEAGKKLNAPSQWSANSKSGSLFVSKRMKVSAQNPDQLEIVGQGMTHPPVPDWWLDKYDLDILSPTVLEEDPDGDGFNNLDEYLGPDRSPANNDEDSTNPRDKDSHPPYYTKLFLKQWIQVPFRLKFNSYDGDPKKDAPETMNYQINTIDLRQPSVFLKLGEVVPNTKFKLVKFEYKTKRNESIQEDEDVSELTVQNDLGDKIVLIYQKEINSPDSFGLFAYLWPDVKKPVEFKVKKLGNFALKPNVKPEDLFKLVDIDKEGAVIQLPGSDKTYKVPLLPPLLPK